jgi:beta-N-acetylglucosaminidase.
MNNRLFGYIEGYYGRLLSWDERQLLLGAMGQLGLNAYLYAPKEDPFHRQHWREAYPAAWRASFTEFVKQGRKKKIDIAAGIAPGLSYNYCSSADYVRLRKKCGSFIKTGVRAICLLMDDIPARLPASCKKTFSSLGQAHGKLLTRLKADLPTGVSLWFCPTVYADELARQSNEASHYLPDLAATMPSSTVILWTGARVISKNISAGSLRQVNKLFNCNICIWDNLYANDYCPRKLFIGPYKNRDHACAQSTRGVLLNPTGLVYTDIFLLDLLAAFRNGNDPQKAWQSQISKLPFAKELALIAPFIDLPYSSLPQRMLSAGNIKRCQAALKKLIWEWKSPLQREWYPFLYMLDCDLTLIRQTPGRNARQWIEKKYPALLARVLQRKWS